jgi:ribosome-associated toxin RatA of RatAB toxin-antitoxin module
LICTLAFSLIGDDNPNPWKERDSDAEMRVWTRSSPKSDAHEIKVEARTNQPVEHIWAVFEDTDSYPEFMPYVTAVRLLTRKGDAITGELVEHIYQIVTPPFGSKRDYTLQVRSRARPSAGEYTRVWNLANDAGPAPQANMVRIGLCRGRWMFQALSPTSTRIIYISQTDPGGSVPSWLVNRTAVGAGKNAVRAVIERARKVGGTQISCLGCP